MSSASATAGRSQLLFYLSYNGLKYNGVAHFTSDWQIRTVVKVLQHHLVKLMGPSRWVSPMRVSSRTDKEVHALLNTASVRHSGPLDYSPALLRLMLNASLSRSSEAIRVHLIRPTPMGKEFSLVSGVALRQYLYRLALLTKPGLLLMHPEAAWLASSRWLVEPSLDVGRLREAAAVLSGEHDFSGFTNLKGLENAYSPLKRLEIRVDTDAPAERLHACNAFTGECLSACVDLHFASRSFLYKQVRFLTGALVAAARGQVSLDQLRDMLSCPASYVSFKPYDSAPPYGLYLKCVEYADPRWNLTWADIHADNVTLNDEYCRRLLLRFRDSTCPMDIVELTREHEAHVAASSCASASTAASSSPASLDSVARG